MGLSRIYYRPTEINIVINYEQAKLLHDCGATVSPTAMVAIADESVEKGASLTYQPYDHSIWYVNDHKFHTRLSEEQIIALALIPDNDARMRMVTQYYLNN